MTDMLALKLGGMTATTRGTARSDRWRTAAQWLLERYAAAQDEAAKRIARPYLAVLNDRDLRELGHSPSEIRDLRAQHAHSF